MTVPWTGAPPARARETPASARRIAAGEEVCPAGSGWADWLCPLGGRLMDELMLRSPRPRVPVMGPPPSYRSILAAIASTSEAAALFGDRVISGICARILSLTLLSWRITPARGGVNFRKFVQAFANVS